MKSRSIHKEEKQEQYLSLNNHLRADLHIHTKYSDGIHSPSEIVNKCHTAGVTIIAIADHDHVGAISEATNHGNTLGMEVIAGVELSVTMDDLDIHVLGYFIDPTNRRLLDSLLFFRHERFKRAERIVRKLNQLNIPITMEAVLRQAGEGAIGRPHIAGALMAEGLIDSYQEAFIRFIGSHAPAYEKKYEFSPIEAINLISSAGGLSFIAHPGKYTTDAVLFELIRYGLDGIEVVHPSHSATQVNFYRNLTNQYFLLESGGSDFHGGGKNDDWTLGAYTIPLDCIQKMKTRLFSK